MATEATAALAQWAHDFRLEDAPPAVVDRMKALVLDLLRVVAVGARLPWSRAVRRLVLELGSRGTSTVLLAGDRLDAAHAAFVNGAFAHACDLDDTHVGSMHDSVGSILPAVLAVAEQHDARCTPAQDGSRRRSLPVSRSQPPMASFPQTSSMPRSAYRA